MRLKVLLLVFLWKYHHYQLSVFKWVFIFLHGVFCVLAGSSVRIYMSRRLWSGFSVQKRRRGWIWYNAPFLESAVRQMSFFLSACTHYHEIKTKNKTTLSTTNSSDWQTTSIPWRPASRGSTPMWWGTESCFASLCFYSFCFPKLIWCLTSHLPHNVRGSWIRRLTSEYTWGAKSWTFSKE